MPMIAGAVSVNPAGVATGVGLAKEIYDDFLPKVPGIGGGPLGALAKTQIADLCNSVASKTIAHIVANATVTVPSGVAVTVAVPAGTGSTIAPGIGTVA